MSTQNWQESVDPLLLQRLLRPAVQPGTIDPKFARGRMARSQQFVERFLALVDRYGAVQESLEDSNLAIVYAQISGAPQQVPRQGDATTVASPIVQAKLAINAALNAMLTVSSPPAAAVSPPRENARGTGRVVRADSGNSLPVVRAEVAVNPRSEVERFLALPEMATPSRHPTRRVPEMAGHSSVAVLPIVSTDAAKGQVIDSGPLVPAFAVARSPATIASKANQRDRDEMVPVAIALPPPRPPSSPPVALELARSHPPSPVASSEIPSTQLHRHPPKPEPARPPTTPPSTLRKTAKIDLDLDAIAHKVERKIVRKLTLERERKGQLPWR